MSDGKAKYAESNSKDQHGIPLSQWPMAGIKHKYNHALAHFLLFRFLINIKITDRLEGLSAQDQCMINNCSDFSELFGMAK